MYFVDNNFLNSYLGAQDKMPAYYMYKLLQNSLVAWHIYSSKFNINYIYSSKFNIPKGTGRWE